MTAHRRKEEHENMHAKKKTDRKSASFGQNIDVLKLTSAWFYSSLQRILVLIPRSGSGQSVSYPNWQGSQVLQAVDLLICFHSEAW